MKKGFTAVVASAVMYSVAFASPTANEPSFTGLNATEHAALFGEGSTAQAVALDGAEMKATEGEVINFAVGGAIGLATYYGTSWYFGKPTTWQGAAYAVGTGALTGGIGGIGVKMAGGGLAANVAIKGNMATKNFALQQLSPYNRLGRRR